MSAPNEQLRSQYARDGIDITAYFALLTILTALATFPKVALVAFTFTFINYVNMKWNAKRIPNWAGFILGLLALPVLVLWIGSAL